MIGHLAKWFLEVSQPVVLASYHGSMKTEMTSGSEMLSDRKQKWHAQP